MTVDSLLTQVENIARREGKVGQEGSFSAISRVLRGAFSSGPCPILRSDVDHGLALRQLIRFAMSHEYEIVASPLMQIAGSIAFTAANPHDRVPAELFLNAMNTSRTAAARVQAARVLIREATDATIRNRLADILRRASGPPAWPNLPSDVIGDLEFMYGQGAALLEDEILRAPHLVRNPLARWIIECGRGHPIPRAPTDPCHPGNAPPPLNG